MSVETYLGNPSAKIVEWIKSHAQPSGHADTWYKYDGDTEWRMVSIKGTIAVVDDMGEPTGQIENPFDIVAIEIGTDVTRIGEYAFYQCNDALTSVMIPNSVTYIGDSTFSGCSLLTNVTIPDSVTDIEQYAFLGCSGLASVTIGNGVTNIGDRAFYNCNGLASVTFLGKTMEQVQNIEDGNGGKCYPWGIKDTSIIVAEGDGSNSN